MSTDPHAERFGFDDASHREHCIAAGCRHPVVHRWGAQGWCKLCRKVAAERQLTDAIEDARQRCPKLLVHVPPLRRLDAALKGWIEDGHV